VPDVPLVATDKAGNVKNETWRVDNGAAGPTTFTYDADGNLTADGTRTYTWDKRSRLSTIVMGANTWLLNYDGANRRNKETKNTVKVREWVWNGTSSMEERIGSGTVPTVKHPHLGCLDERAPVKLTISSA
jgi:hypothetical protein